MHDANFILKQDIDEKLSFDPALNSKNIITHVEKGIAVLSGTVGTYYEKNLAENAVRAVRGVRAVVDEIEVNLKGSLKRSDLALAEAAIRALEWDTSLTSDKIQVTVDKGVVKLSGEVEHQYQKENAYKNVHRLFGVRNVINLITVKPPLKIQNVTKEIMKEFQRNAVLDAQSIHVEIEDTKIILKGQVRSSAEYEEAKKAAWSLSGVTEVDTSELHIFI